MSELLDVTKLNGYSHTLEESALKTLVQEIDWWVEFNEGMIGAVYVNPEFASRLFKETEKMFDKVETLVGQAEFRTIKNFPLDVRVAAENSSVGGGFSNYGSKSLIDNTEKVITKEDIERAAEMSEANRSASMPKMSAEYKHVYYGEVRALDKRNGSCTFFVNYKTDTVTFTVNPNSKLFDTLLQSFCNSHDVVVVLDKEDNVSVVRKVVTE